MTLEVIPGGQRSLEMIKFDPPARLGLSRSDLMLLQVLENAVEAYGWVYAAQVDDRFPGANVYPYDVTKEEVLRAASRNPMILDPYHKVSRTGSGGLDAVPYHVAYETRNKPVVDLLREASRIAPLDQATYFLSEAKALALGVYEDAMKDWLSMTQEPTIDAMIQPNDRYDDRLLNRKYFAWGSVGILNREATDRAQIEVEELLDLWEQQGPRPEGMQRPRIRARIDQTTMISGLAARYELTANSLPCQREWREKYGNKFLVFQPPFEERITFEQQPFLMQVVDTERLPDMSREDLIQRSFDIYLGHEVFHPIIRRSGDEERLGGSYTTFSELSCDVQSLHKLNQLKGLTDSQDHILAIFFTKAVSDIKVARDGKRVPYAKARRVLINYLADSKVICRDRGFIRWSSAQRVFQALEGLIVQLETIAVLGTESDFNNLMTPLSSNKFIGKLNLLQTVEY